MNDSVSVRLDKWLWAARIFKTRSLATDAIKGGRVHVDGQRVKPGKSAQVNQIIRINKSQQRFEIEVLFLCDKRGNFTIAQTLYKETVESIAQREHETELHKLANQTLDSEFKGRPTKRNRRLIEDFTHSWNE